MVVTDSPTIHLGKVKGSVVPSNINLSDGGMHREPDLLYGVKGMRTIFAENFSSVDTTDWHLSDYRAYLEAQPFVKNQLFELEEVLASGGGLLIFHPIAHPIFAAEELLWRAMKWDYRTNFAKSSAELMFCVKRWLSDPEEPLDSTFTSGYFSTARAFVDYYLSGGVETVSEREVKRMKAEYFESIPNADENRKTAMGNFYDACPNLPRTLQARQRATPQQVFDGMREYVHQVNYQRLNVTKNMAIHDESDDEMSED